MSSQNSPFRTLSFRPSSINRAKTAKNTLLLQLAVAAYLESMIPREAKAGTDPQTSNRGLIKTTVYARACRGVYAG